MGDDVRLVPVTAENWRSVIDLEVTEEQSRCFSYRTTKPNLYSLAQARVEPDAVPLAIVSGDAPVGMLLYTPENGDGDAWLTRIMVDWRHQRGGVGRRAVELLIERVRGESRRGKCRLGLSYEPENAVAAKLYASMGFRESGEMLGEQRVAWVGIAKG